jgi:hypothetical protein
MHPTSLQQVRPTDVLQTKPSLCCCTKHLVALFLLSSTNHRHPWAQQSERMSEAWFAKTLQVCHMAETLQVCHVAPAVVLVDIGVLVAYLP